MTELNNRLRCVLSTNMESFNIFQVLSIQASFKVQQKIKILKFWVVCINPIQARLFLLFKGPRGGGFKDLLMISGTIKASPMKPCTVIVLLKTYQNTKRNFQKYDL